VSFVDVLIAVWVFFTSGLRPRLVRRRLDPCCFRDQIWITKPEPPA